MTTTAPETTAERYIKLGVIGVVALVLAMLVCRHVQGVNGAWWWFWPWRHEGMVRTYGLMLLAAIPLVVGHALYARWPAREVYFIPLLMLSAYAMMLVNVLMPTHPMGLDLLRDDVRSPYAMSYYSDAQALQSFDGWFAQYDKVLPQLNLHAQTKPAGPILYFTLFLNAFGAGEQSAILSGLTIGLIATISIAMTYWLIALLTGRRDVGFFAASFVALCPGYLLSFPLLDGCYMIFSCALVGLWSMALARNRVIYSAIMGAMVAGMLVVTFTVTTLALFLVAYAIFCTGLSTQSAIRRAAIHAAVAFGVLVVALAILWLLTGYNVPAVFQTAYTNQHRIISAAHSPSIIHTAPFNLIDFALGTGWVSYPLALFGVRRAWVELGRNHRLTRTMLCAVAMPIVLAILGLYPTETSRVWNFLLPLVALPIGFELAHWRTWERCVAIACLWIAVATLTQNLWIVMPWV